MKKMIGALLVGTVLAFPTTAIAATGAHRATPKAVAGASNNFRAFTCWWVDGRHHGGCDFASGAGSSDSGNTGGQGSSSGDASQLNDPTLVSSGGRSFA